MTVTALIVSVSAPRSETLAHVQGTMYSVSAIGFQAEEGDAIRLHYRGERPALVRLDSFDEGNTTSQAFLAWPQVSELDSVIEIPENHDVWIVYINQIPLRPEIVPLSYELKVDRLGMPPSWAWSAIGLQLAATVVAVAGAGLAIRDVRGSRSHADLPRESGP